MRAVNTALKCRRPSGETHVQSQRTAPLTDSCAAVLDRVADRSAHWCRIFGPEAEPPKPSVVSAIALTNAIVS